MSKASKNTDRELYREVEDDYYANSIFVTEDSRIGMNVGGHVIVQPIADWHRLAEGSDLAATDSSQEQPIESAKVTDTNDIEVILLDIWRAGYLESDEVLIDRKAFNNYRKVTIDIAKQAIQNLIAQETNKALIEEFEQIADILNSSIPLAQRAKAIAKYIEYRHKQLPALTADKEEAA